ncbi:MAG: D-glucuronyl C5-epimerase family protein [Candidatus Thermoplasmatota archaeon]|nr:D-glucuronyl C5-epimerase family protein [Candidatus Thermoplasmatota archaeon]
MVYTNFHQSQIFRYFGFPIFDVGHPKLELQDFRNGKYYWDLSPKFKYDNNLIDYLPIRTYNKKQDISPINVAQVGIALLDTDYNRDSFYAINKWIKNNIFIRKGLCQFLIHYSVPTFGISSPWLSGLGQGLMLSYLVRYHRKFGDEIFEQIIDKVLLSLISDVKNGGCCRKWKDHVIIEEYIGKRIIGVLNGHISAILGIRDFLEYYDDNTKIRSFLDENIVNLRKNILEWNGKHWSYYNLHNPKLISSIFYQELHITQMNTLTKIYQSKEFEVFLAILNKQYYSFINRIIAFYLKYSDVLKGKQKI